MLFKAISFVMSVSASADVKKAGGATQVKVNLTESEIPEGVVVASAISGQSPRVRLQGALRESGIPRDKNITLSWEKYLGTAKLGLAVIPETPDQILARAKADPVFMAELMARWSTIDKAPVDESEGDEKDE